MITRAKEYLTIKETGTTVAKHVSYCQTCKNSQLSVKNFYIMKQCRNDYRSLINEALIIKKHNPVLNKQQQTTGNSYLLRVFCPPLK